MKISLHLIKSILLGMLLITTLNAQESVETESCSDAFDICYDKCESLEDGFAECISECETKHEICSESEIESQINPD